MRPEDPPYSPELSANKDTTEKEKDPASKNELYKRITCWQETSVAEP